MPLTHRFAAVFAGVSSLLVIHALVTSVAVAGPNDNFTLPLHAEIGVQACGPLAVDCRSTLATVNVPPHTGVTIYLMAANHINLAGVQTAFEWDSEWVFLGSIFDCAPAQLNAVVPAVPGGPTAGSVATAFNCVTHGDLLILGRLLMTSGSIGCVRQVQSSYPFGIHVIDCVTNVDQILAGQEYRLGTICVSTGGHDACNIPSPAVAPTTWGQIKASYR